MILHGDMINIPNETSEAS